MNSIGTCDCLATLDHIIGIQAVVPRGGFSALKLNGQCEFNSFLCVPCSTTYLRCVTEFHYVVKHYDINMVCLATYDWTETVTKTSTREGVVTIGETVISGTTPPSTCACGWSEMDLYERQVCTETQIVDHWWHWAGPCNCNYEPSCFLCANVDYAGAQMEVTQTQTLSEPYTFSEFLERLDSIWATMTCEALMAKFYQNASFVGEKWDYTSGVKAVSNAFFPTELVGVKEVGEGCNSDNFYLQVVAGPLTLGQTYSLLYNSNPGCNGSGTTTCTQFIAEDDSVCVRPDNIGTQSITPGPC